MLMKRFHVTVAQDGGISSDISIQSMPIQARVMTVSTKVANVSGGKRSTEWIILRDICEVYIARIFREKGQD